ncbi:MAG TPA: metal-dependent transcriptional regulator [Clostridia bacterium]|jgi:Mn-dependent DtxR family transcriptional regulator|nr:metal-dependent transcriptional regulator [Clostridia bacterium]
MARIKESGENYLETILILKKKLPSGVVRSVDIVEELGYSKSSVSRAVNLLKNNGYINIAKTGEITFTEKGRAHVTDLYERHQVLTEFLISLGVDADIAEEDACRVEHIISEESFNAIKREINK